MNARLVLIAFVLFQFIACGPVAAQKATTETNLFAKISLRNNSWKWQRFTIVTFRPGERSNSTYVFRLAPGMWRNFWLPADTRVYRATPQQTDALMSGKPIDWAPLLTVSKNDDGRVVPLLP